MFIRVKNMMNKQELNINATNIILFEPANDGINSKITLSDGNSYVVEQSNRALRHACKKALPIASGEAASL